MPATLAIELPAWLDERLSERPRIDGGDESRMQYVLELARENVEQETGGPFAAAIFERAGGRVVGSGVNLVVPGGSSVLHAEIVAFLVAQRAVGSYTLAGDDLPDHDLVASCDPCAMCLGATLWSGVRRVVSGATGDDAQSFGFDEGPVFAASYAYLEARGIEIVRGVLRPDARSVFEAYRDAGGIVYNG